MRFSKFMFLLSNSEVYTLEVDFLNLKIYIQT